MSEPRLSPATRSLLRAAKGDAPNAVARAKVWSGVASAVGGAAGAAGAAGSASAAPGALVTGGAGASKMLVLGTLLGGTVTVGLAAMLLRIGPAPAEPPDPASAPIAALATASPATPPDPPPLVFPAVDPPAPPPTAAVRSPAIHATVTPPVPSVGDDGLAREASLVVEAREALGRGDPQSALRAIRAARVLPSHQLAPEELAVEARALRALGRDDQAREVDSTLRKRFPESALAR